MDGVGKARARGRASAPARPERALPSLPQRAQQREHAGARDGQVRGQAAAARGQRRTWTARADGRIVSATQPPSASRRGPKRAPASLAPRGRRAARATQSLSNEVVVVRGRGRSGDSQHTEPPVRHRSAVSASASARSGRGGLGRGQRRAPALRSSSSITNMPARRVFSESILTHARESQEIAGNCTLFRAAQENQKNFGNSEGDSQF